jgi:hypothetical protein
VGWGGVVLEFLTDQHFLSALAAAIGPLAFFAAPTEEIEHLLYADDVDEIFVDEEVDMPMPEGFSLPKAA